MRARLRNTAFRPLFIRMSSPLIRKSLRTLFSATGRKRLSAQRVCSGLTRTPNTAYIFEQSGRQKYATDDGDWIAAFPEEDRKEILAMNPDIAAAWHPVYGDRVNKLVFIGRKMDKEAIIKALDECIEK